MDSGSGLGFKGGFENGGKGRLRNGFLGGSALEKEVCLWVSGAGVE